jgi:glycosyltransferase involved in cell wall biosynthesis
MFTEGAPCERCKGGKYWNAVRYHCLAAGFLPNVLAVAEMKLTKVRESYEKTIDAWLCPSRFIKEKMEDWGEPGERMIVVPNPAEIKEMPAKRGGGYLLYAGRLSPEKGLPSFIEAAAKMPETQVKIAGRGPEEERLKSLVSSLGATNIQFLGFQQPDELSEIRNRAEAVILPTLSYENCSTTLLEAMGDGLPCLATRIGGNPELVEDGVNGFLVKPNDSDDWLRGLRRFAATPKEIRDKMAEAGREKIRQRHDWDAHLDKVLEIYQAVSKRK